MRSSILVVAILAAFAVGFALRPFYVEWMEGENSGKNLQQGMQGLINPLLDCATENSRPVLQSEISKAVETVVNTATRQGDASVVSVYFRDLNNGPTFGLNETEKFAPASLLKVPVMMAAFSKLENDPNFFARTRVYDPDRHVNTNINQIIEPPDALEKGKTYTYDFLVARMILLSDNAATVMLVEDPEIDTLQTLQDMGLNMKDDVMWLTVKQYASIFRILYNATYLPKKFSAGALHLLTQCHFKEGLPKGVPSGVPVAHKFGERSIGDIYQFHDCGIVYHPYRPYLLCVMSRGKDTKKLIETVAGISRVVYEKVSQRQP